MQTQTSAPVLIKETFQLQVAGKPIKVSYQGKDPFSEEKRSLLRLAIAEFLNQGHKVFVHQLSRYNKVTWEVDGTGVLNQLSPFIS